MGEDIRESFVPFNLNRYSLEEEIKELTTYCLHDVRMTYKVFEEVYYKYEAQLGLIEYFNLDDSLFNKTEAQLSAYILGARKSNYNRNDMKYFEIVDSINKTIPDKLDKSWYISIAKDRLESFIPEDSFTLFDYFNGI